MYTSFIGEGVLAHLTVSQNGVFFDRPYRANLSSLSPPPFESRLKISKFCIFSCSLGRKFSSTHSIFTILGFLERSPREEETEVTHDDQDAISPAPESSELAKTA